MSSYLAAAIGAAIFASSLLAQATRPIRVALYDFDQSNVANNIVKELGHRQEYGKIISDLLLPKLINGNAEVISRDQIERLLKEQNYKYSDRFDASQAAQYGKLLGVDAIITGTLDSLFIEQRTRNIVVRQKTFITATVDATAKMISTATGRVLAAPTYRGRIEREMGTAYLGQAPAQQGRPNQQTAPGGETGSKQGADPFIRDALRECATQIGKELVMQFPNLQQIDLTRVVAPPAPGRRGPEASAAKESAAPAVPYMPLDDEVGVVMKVAEQSITFTPGPDAKVKAGDTLEVQRADSVINPRTQKQVVIGEKVGVVEVEDMKAAYGRARVTSGTVAVSDRLVAVKVVAKPPSAASAVKKAGVK